MLLISSWGWWGDGVMCKHVFANSYISISIFILYMPFLYLCGNFFLVLQSIYIFICHFFSCNYSSCNYMGEFIHAICMFLTLCATFIPQTSAHGNMRIDRQFLPHPQGFIYSYVCVSKTCHTYGTSESNVVFMKYQPYSDISKISGLKTTICLTKQKLWYQKEFIRRI